MQSKQTKNSHNLILSPSTLVLPLSTPNSVLTLICYFSFVPVVIEGVLAGLLTLEQIHGAPAPMGSLPGRSSLDYLRQPVKTDLTGCLYRSDRQAGPEAGQARLQPAHEQVLRCVTRSRVNTLFW
jgi:hypothetical protein